jgi:cytochrome c553
MERLATYFSAMPGLENNATSPSSPGLDRFGQPLPACSNCHTVGKAAPIIAGQKPGYLAARLRLWQQDGNVIDARLPPDTMAMIARRIPDDQIDELARTVARPGAD